MSNYTHEYSNFPQEIIQKHNFKDIDNSVSTIVNTIKSLQSQGLYNEASKLIKDNQNELSKYFIDMSVINGMIEHIRNTQICALGNKQYIFTDDNLPIAWNIGDVWIGGE